MGFQSLSKKICSIFTKRLLLSQIFIIVTMVFKKHQKSFSRFFYFCKGIFCFHIIVLRNLIFFFQGVRRNQEKKIEQELITLLQNTLEFIHWKFQHYLWWNLHFALKFIGKVSFGMSWYTFIYWTKVSSALYSILQDCTMFAPLFFWCHAICAHAVHIHIIRIHAIHVHAIHVWVVLFCGTVFWGSNGTL